MTTSKLRSAVGRLMAELIVIVLGVLIALYVDSWRDARSQRADAEQYLALVREDIVGHVGSLERALAWVDNSVASAERVLPVLDGRRGVPTDTARFVADVYQPTRLLVGNELASPTFEDLRRTDRLALITDPRLRRDLLDYFSQATRTQELFELLPRSYRDAVRATLPPRMGPALLTLCPVSPVPPQACSPELDHTGDWQFLKSLHNNPKLAGHLRMIATQLLHTRPGFQRQLDQARQTIESIDGLDVS